MSGKCQKCGCPSSNNECPDCQYRNGGKLSEREEQPRDIVGLFILTSERHFRDEFTSDQLQQISQSER
jgi:hypothetical protein